MNRLNSFAVPALLAGVAIGAIPTLPTFPGSAPAVNGIVVADDGAIYFSDAFHRAVWRLLPGTKPSLFAAARTTRSLRIDAANAVYETPGPMSGSIARTALGELIVAHGSAVSRIEGDGRVTTIVADEPLLAGRTSFLRRLLRTPERHLTGITVTAAGDIFVANAAHRTIVHISSAGDARLLMTCERGWTPAGLASSDQDVYVLEHGRGARVRRIGPDGGSTVIAWVRPDAASSSVARVGGPDATVATRASSMVALTTPRTAARPSRKPGVRSW